MDGILFHQINFLFFTDSIGLKRAAGSSGEAEKSTSLKQGEMMMGNDTFAGFC